MTQAAEPLLLRGGRLLTPDGWLDDADILLEGGSIAAVERRISAPQATVVDVRDRLVVPGLIDIHVHGAAGAMCEDGSSESIRRISSTLATCGITGFLSTLATLPWERTIEAVSAIASVAGSEPGARILGIHLEGPCLNPLRAGAQATQWMRAMSPDELDQLQQASGDRVRLITLAPEVEGAMTLLRHAVAHGVVVAVGHSNATESEMEQAAHAGATHVTHLFDAMRPLHHREPGVVGVALTDDEMSVELICDGHHLAPRTVDLIFRCKPPGQVVFVSDAVAALGLPDGDCEIFGVPCRIEGGAVRLRDGGQLAGSCLRLDAAVRHVREWLPREPVENLLRAASSSPARVIRAGACGELRAGYIADVAVLDSRLEVVATICRGRPRWQR